MGTHSRSTSKAIVDESYFERKGRDLIVPDEEIEAWELEAQDLEGLGCPGLDLAGLD